MKSIIKTEKLIYIAVVISFISAFVIMHFLTDERLRSLNCAEPVIVHDVTKEESDRRVYVTPSGEKYHLDGCKFLTDDKTEISLSLAKNTYEPCAYCQP
ncbi:MAG: hypothetical protein IKV21_05355 [Clostridia bacterium]|nr:hypothetical protein [Clostridia bacterium]